MTAQQNALLVRIDKLLATGDIVAQGEQELAGLRTEVEGLGEPRNAGTLYEIEAEVTEIAATRLVAAA